MKKGLSLFLAAWFAISSAPSCFQTTFFLAPSTKKMFFTLNEAQIKQAAALSKTIAAVRAFLEKEKRSDTVTLIGVDEISPHSYQAKIESQAALDDLIPQLRFYKIFGNEGLRDLQKQIDHAITGNKALPTTLKIKLTPPIGLYKFLALSHELKETPPLFVSAELSSFHRTCTAHNKPFHRLDAAALRKRLEGFRLNEPIELFSNQKKERLFKEKLLTRDKLANTLLLAISDYLKTIDELRPLGDPTLLNTVLVNASANYPLRDEIIAALQENKGESLKDFLIETGKKIQNYHIVFGHNGKTYLNLPALVKDPFNQSEEILAGITQVEILLEPLLQIAERPENKLIQEILRRLSHPKKPMAGAYEAGLSNFFSNFSQDIFYDPDLFLNLLKILTRTAKFTPVLKSFADTEDYGFAIQKNILSSLQKARPHWFEEALNFLDDPIKLPDMLAFLSATGWVDSQVYWQLQPETNSDDVIIKTKDKIKTLLSQRVVVTSTTLNATADSITALKRSFQQRRGFLPTDRLNLDPKNLPWGKLSLFNFIKHKLFFGKEPVDTRTIGLMFLSWEDFLKISEKEKTVEKIPGLLSRNLGLKKGGALIGGLLHYAFHIHTVPYTAPALLFHSLVPRVVNLGNPQHTDDHVNRFVSFFKQLPLSQKERSELLRNLFYFYIEENFKGEFLAIFNETLFLKIRSVLIAHNPETAEEVYSDLLETNQAQLNSAIGSLKRMLQQKRPLPAIWKEMNRLLNKAPDAFLHLIATDFPNLYQKINWNKLLTTPATGQPPGSKNEIEEREKMFALLQTLSKKGLFSHPINLDNFIRTPISLDLLLHPSLVCDNKYFIEKFLFSEAESDSFLEQCL